MAEWKRLEGTNFTIKGGYTMNSNVLTILSITLMIVSVGYFLVYIYAKKKNKQVSIKYKIVFSSIILLLVIPIIYTAF